MKTFLIILTFFFFKANATDYYWSSAGNNSNAGTIGSPFQTLAKLSTLILSAGDRCYLNRGDVFTGPLTPLQSGTSGSRIVFDAYGSGALPILSGMTAVTTWLSLGNNIYESAAITTSITPDIVTKNGTILAKGRYPNSDAANGGYLKITARSGLTSVTALTLPTTWNFTGAELIMRSSRYQIDRVFISSHNTTNHVLTYTGSSGFSPTVGHGIFIQNSVLTLDKQNEWYYNPTTKKIRMWSTTMPTNIKAATVTNLLTTSGRNYITFQNINFDGCNGNAISLSTGTGIIIQNCTVNNAGISGVQNTGSDRFTFQNNILTRSMDGGLRIGSSAFANNILNNTIDSIACVLGLQQNDASHGNGIFVDATCDTLRVIGNSFTNIGYAGINFRSSDSLVIANNYFANWNVTSDDGGAIYGFGNTVSTNWGRYVKNNIIRNAVGAPLGTTAVPGSSTYSASFGIYWDKALGNIQADSNHIHNAGRAAVFYNYLTHHIFMRYNTLDSTQYLVYINRDSANDLTNNLFKRNILFTRGTQKAVWFENFRTSVRATFGSFDSNNIVHLNTNTTPFVSHTKSGTNNYTFATWRSSLGYELRGDTLQTASNSVIRENYATTTDNVVNLGAHNWIDAKRTFYAKNLTLNPYKSSVLKQWQLVGSVPPTITVNVTGSFITPGNVTLTANATSGSALITDVKFYNGATLLSTDASNPYSYNWTGLTAGTYTVTAKATDANGLITTSSPITVTITNPLPIVAITSPDNGTTYTAPASVVIAATASITTGSISKINYYSGGVWIGTDNTSPYEFTWSSVPVGTYSLTVVAVSSYGDSTTSTAKSITVNGANLPPVVSLTSPTAGSSTTTNYTVSANASDPDGTISQVRFYDNGVLIETFASAPYESLETFSVGSHYINAQATDDDGAITTSAPVIITVLAPNVFPTISIITPASDTSIAEPADIDLAATAADSDGTVSVIHWYENGTYVGSGSTLSLTRNAGGYSYKATAVDNSGDSTTSASITVSVVIPEPQDPDSLSASVQIVTPILCNGGSALVRVEATGGTEPITGDIGDHTETAGVKEYIIEDANGLKDTIIIAINEPGTLSATATVGTILQYLGSTDAIINPIGGTAPFEYSINAGVTWQNSNTFTVTAGNYIINVRDVNGCTTSVSFQVTQPASNRDKIIHGRGKKWLNL